MTIVCNAPAEGSTGESKVYECTARTAWKSDPKSYYYHNLKIKTEDDKVVWISYTSIEQHAHDCGVEVGRDSKEYHWQDYGRKTLLTHYEPIAGEWTKIQLEREEDYFKVHLLDLNPGYCGIRAYIANVAILHKNKPQCELKDDTTTMGAVSRKEKELLASRFAPGAQFGYAFGPDLNGDGWIKSDIVAEFNATGLMAAVQGADETYEPILTYRGEGNKLTLDGAYAGGPDQIAAPHILISEYFPKSEWHGELVYTGGEFRVTSEDDIPYAGVNYFISRDFERLMGRREFTHGATGAAQLAQTTRFKPIFAVRRQGKVAIDGRLTERAWRDAPKTAVTERAFVGFHPERWRGAGDLAFEVASLWDEAFLYLGIVVSDQRVVQPLDGDAVLNGDHVELWFHPHAHAAASLDAAGTLQPGIAPDPYLRQIAVSATAQPGAPDQAIRLWYPETGPMVGAIRESLAGARTASQRSQQGYTLELQIPLAALGVTRITPPRPFTRPARPQGLITLAVSDTDNPKAPKQEKLMATSQLKWGNPSTLGELYFLEKFELPRFVAEP